MSENSENPELTLDEDFKAYIGTKVILAKSMFESNFSLHKHNKLLEGPDRAGYLVRYPDGYESWSPKSVLDNAYREVLMSEFLAIEETVVAAAKKKEVSRSRSAINLIYGTSLFPSAKLDLHVKGPEEKGSCGICMYFNAGTGECRESAPRTADGFPGVNGSDWCGNFEPK